VIDAFIYDHVRTPRGRGRPDGGLHGVTPVQLATHVLVALQARNELDTSSLEDVVFGCVTPIGEQGANIARTAVLNADYAQSVSGQQLNRFCASGLDAVNSAAAHIMCGQAEANIAGGVESMSRVPMGADGGAVYADPQVTYKNYYVPQGISADLIATLDGYSREQLDTYAMVSQSRAAHAWQECYFERSIVLGSVLGWGFPTYTGGVLSYIDTLGVKRFVDECAELARQHGPRFEPSAWLQARAGAGEKFYSAAKLTRVA
jgi:acetyl-CoA C-acetyltransferase